MQNRILEIGIREMRALNVKKISPSNHINISSLSQSPLSHADLAEKASVYLKRHPDQLNHHFVSQFTPEAASLLILESRSDRAVILKFLQWARRHDFFDAPCKCLVLHVLTRLKLYKTAQSLAEDVAASVPDRDGKWVFDMLKESYYKCDSSSAVFDLVVKSYSKLGLIEKSRNIVGFAKGVGFMPGVLSYNSILDAMVRSKWSVNSVEEVYADMIGSGVSPNVFTFNILMRGFCVAGNLEMGLYFLGEMEKKGCLPNVVTYNTLMDAYCKSGRVDEGYNLLRTMALKNLEPNLISYNVMINGLCREGKMKETTEVLKDMGRKGFFPDEVTYNTLINGYCKSGDIHQALVLHAEMLRNGLSPNVITYTSLISSMCKARNLNRAMGFFDQMHVRGLRPNQRTYTTLIDGFAQMGFLEETSKLLEKMKGAGFSPTIVTYNAMINGLCIKGKMEEALRIIQEMEHIGVPPDVVSYSTVITGFSKYGDLDKAIQTKEKMVGKGIKSDAITFSTLIQGFCTQRRLDIASELFQEMFQIGLVPDQVTYTTLINGHCAEDNLSKAFALHEEMIGKGFLPDVVTYSVLINGLNKQARTREAKKLLLKLFYDDSVPSGVTFDTLIDNCTNAGFKSAAALLKGFCMKGLMNEADRLFYLMLRQSHKPDEVVYDVIIHGHCSTGNTRKAYDMYKDMVLAGLVPHTVTVAVLLKSLHANGMNDEVIEVVTNTLKSCKLGDAEVAKVLVEVNCQEGNMDAVFNVLSGMARDGLLPNSGRTVCTGAVDRASL